MGCSGESFTVMMLSCTEAEWVRLTESSLSLVCVDHVPTSLYPFQNKGMRSMPFIPEIHDYRLCGLLRTRARFNDIWLSLREQASYLTKAVENRAEVFESAQFLRPLDCKFIPSLRPAVSFGPDTDFHLWFYLELCRRKPQTESRRHRLLLRCQHSVKCRADWRRIQSNAMDGRALPHVESRLRLFRLVIMVLSTNVKHRTCNRWQNRRRVWRLTDTSVQHTKAMTFIRKSNVLENAMRTRGTVLCLPHISELCYSSWTASPH